MWPFELCEGGDKITHTQPLTLWCTLHMVRLEKCFLLFALNMWRLSKCVTEPGSLLPLHRKHASPYETMPTSHLDPIPDLPSVKDTSSLWDVCCVCETEANCDWVWILNHVLVLAPPLIRNIIIRLRHLELGQLWQQQQKETHQQSDKSSELNCAHKV